MGIYLIPEHVHPFVFSELVDVMVFLLIMKMLSIKHVTQLRLDPVAVHPSASTPA